MRNNKKELNTIQELKELVIEAISTQELKIASNPNGSGIKKNQSAFHNIDRYNFTLKLLSKFKKELKTNVKNTSNGSVNLGELAEVYIKHLKHPNKRVIRTSPQGQNDLDRRNKAEIKAVTKHSRSNSWKSNTGAIVLFQGSDKIRGGIYWINAPQLLQQFKNNERLSFSKLALVIENNNLKVGQGLGL